MRPTLRFVRAIWLRGFGPAAFIAACAAASCFVAINWQGGGFPSRPWGTSDRVQLFMGRLIVQLGDQPPGFAAPRPAMTLGEAATKDLNAVQSGWWFVPWNPFSTGHIGPGYWRVYLYSWFVQVQLVYVALLLALPPVISRVLRSRRAAWECRRCRYDLRGLPAAAACPECGAEIVPGPPA